MTERHQLSRRNVLSAAVAALSIAAVPAPFVASGRAVAATRRAPRWDISQWINGDGGNVDTLRGKVIVIDFFQLWCPGCNRVSGPLMKHWQEKFAAHIGAGRLVMVKIHTVFEGHSYQTVERLKHYVKEKDITIPVGVDRHVDGRRVPETMRRYNTGGTPEMVIIGPEGLIRFQKFGFFDPATVEPMIVEMLQNARV